MLRFKSFRGTDMAAVEREINGWLSEAEPDVKMMDQEYSIAGEAVVSFLYDEGFQASERRLTVEAAAIVENAMKQPVILEPIKVDEENV